MNRVGQGVHPIAKFAPLSCRRRRLSGHAGDTAQPWRRRRTAKYVLYLRVCRTSCYRAASYASYGSYGQPWLDPL